MTASIAAGGRLPASRALRILALEDSDDDVELLAHELLAAGHPVELHRVDTLSDFSRALDVEPWDVVLADYNLAGFTALDALEVFKSRGRDLPFIVVSGSIGEESAVGVMRAGAHDFFLKGRVARLGAAIERERAEAAVRRERREAVAERERLMADLSVALKMRDEFLMIASHELLTPLTPLELQLANARLIARRDAANPTIERMTGMLERAHRHVRRMTHLVNSLLDVTRINSGSFELQRSEVELGEVVRQAVAAAYDHLERSGSTLTVTVPVPVHGRWDPLALQTAVGNLLSNAIKFGGRQPIELAVSRKGDLGQVSISDRGIGIAPEALARIFERFERAVPAEQYGGFGIGLWITKRIAEAHGGRVAVRSEAGSGSTFTLELPLAS
jgi:signal transduction histidine kinase